MWPNSEIPMISKENDPLSFLEDLLPFKIFQQSTIFRLFVLAKLINDITLCLLFDYELILRQMDVKFIKQYYVLYALGAASFVIILQFCIWCPTVVKFPAQVREMGFNLKCAGDTLYQSILNECKAIKTVIYLNLFMSLLSSLLFFPFNGDEMRFNFIEFIFEKYNPRYKSFVKGINYLSSMLTGYTMLIPLMFCTHYVTHIKFQLLLLNEFVKKIKEESGVRDERYQRRISEKLKFCIYLNNKITRIHKAVMVINNPLGILMIFVSTLTFVSAAFFIVSDVSKESNFRMYAVLFTWFLQVLTYCTTAQSLTDRSEDICINAYNCPWICWNVKNRKNLLVFLINNLKPLKVTIYITETNHALLVKLWRLAYAVLTCLVKVNRNN
ncbi:unnamed protein product [Phyllotreta striolata]|uniref:Odorant receptor n=1 Tax=Phyllotreta striolata TaxID=444603 RepID=A0A9N9TP15_PHYSR|nr:unnamed protein product [Phyllotreta striolata]